MVCSHGARLLVVPRPAACGAPLRCLVHGRMRLVAVESPGRVRVRAPRRGKMPRCPAVGGPLGVAIIFWVVLQEESALSLSFTWAFGGLMPKNAR